MGWMVFCWDGDWKTADQLGQDSSGGHKLFAKNEKARTTGEGEKKLYAWKLKHEPLTEKAHCRLEETSARYGASTVLKYGVTRGEDGILRWTRQ